MSEGGDLALSADFAQRLQAWCKENDIAFIIDEVQTGVVQTGKQWGYEHWNLPSPPDYLTFAKKMLSCGVYYQDESKMYTPFRHFNTFFGDPVRAILTAELNKVVKEDKLIDLVNEVGDHLKGKLEDLSKKYPKHIQNVRGTGTYLAFDSETVEDRTKMIGQLKKHGVIQGVCGDNTTRLRPCLYFEKSHADLYLEKLDKACSDLA